MTRDSIDLRLLSRYFDGTATDQEKAAVLAWIGADAERRAAVAELKAAWAGNARRLEAPYNADAAFARVASHAGIPRRVSGGHSTAWDGERAITRWRASLDARGENADRVADRLALANRAQSILRVLRPQPPRVRWSVQAAAILVFVIGASVLLDDSGRRQPAAEDHRVATVHMTGLGERAHVTLSDGSKVILAPASRLRVASDFGVERRDLYLEGEAYFDVVHDKRPFTVFSASAATRDLGTAFGVRAYPDDPSVRVAVREGAVVLSGAGKLTAGDIGQLSRNGSVSVKRGANVDKILGWTRGEFTYEATPLREVLGDLQRWRGLDVVLADSTLGEARFTGALTGIPNSFVVQYLAAAAGLDVERKSATLVLRRHSSRQPTS